MERPFFRTILATLCLFAITLAAASTALAHHKPGHKGGPPHAQEGKRGGPPAWAPAWGYRSQKAFKYRRHGVVYDALPADLVRLPEIGRGSCNREVIGAVLGGAVGATVGSQIGKGDGRVLATIGGAIVGVLVGGSIGRAMDEADQNCVGQVLERTPNGRTVVWNNPDRNGSYEVTPTRTYQTGDGTYCREYQTKIVIGGKVENAYGTACRKPDGSWEKTA
ncbi:MAG: glycine zipper 2TM domain-containing protein [Alphaproteobacteria bacterium]|nr:glycine zipper 2TM domain-containing protein [Alphaproteobacteria bacterium]